MTDPTPLSSSRHAARPPPLSSHGTHRSDRPSNLRRQDPAPAAADLAAVLDLLRTMPGGMASQIDELTAALTALEYARRYYCDLFELAPDAYIVSDVDGRILEANATALRLIGATRAPTRGRSLLSLMAPDSARAAAAAMRALDQAASQEVAEWDLRIRARGRGPYRSARARVRLLTHRPDAPAQLLWLLRWSPEEEHHRLSAAVGDRTSPGVPADRSLDALVDAVPDALLLLDAEQRVVFGNSAAVRLVGTATGRLLDEVLLAAVHPGDRTRVRRSLLREHPPAGRERGTRFRFRCDNGAWCDLEATLVHLPPGPDPCSALLCLRDVSDFVRADHTAEAFRAYQAVTATLTAGAAGTADAGTIAQRVARLAVPAIADSCLIYLLDADGTARLVAAHHHERNEPLAHTHGPPVGVGAAGRARLVARAIAVGEPLLVPAITPQAPVVRAHDIALADGESALRAASLLALPLTADGGRAIGALLLAYTRSGRHYGDQDLLLGRDLARQLSLVLDCARLARQVQRPVAEATAGSAHWFGGTPGHLEPSGAGVERHVSRREREVLGFLAQGLTNRQIAARLVLSERTVEHHISRMLARFRLSTRTHLAAYALKHGLIGGDRSPSG